jgi:hypothetical protein
MTAASEDRASEVCESLDLLIPLLRVPADPAHAVDSALWRRVRKAAPALGVSTVIAWNVRPFLPPDELTWCRRVLRASWARHHRDLQRLCRIADIFRANSIDCIALKGPALALRYYDPPFLRRPSSDLDLGLRKSDLPRACRALALEGFAPACSVREALALHHHVVLSHPDGTRVELHFRLSHGPLGLEMDGLFDESVPYCLPGGSQIRILAPADEIFHLALHLAADRFGTFFHLYELWKLWPEQPDSVREAVVRKAVDRHFCGVLALTELAFQSTWGRPFLPPEVKLPRTWLGHKVDLKLYRAYLANMVGENRPGVASRLRGRWLDFQLTDHPADAARLAYLVARLAAVEMNRAFRSLFARAMA